MWCSAFRRHLLTLGNNTTNRIESFNSQVKGELRKRRGIPPSLPELVGILLGIVAKKDADATYKCFRNCATVASNVLFPEIQPAGRVYNDAGFKLIEGQAKKMKAKTLKLHVGPSDSLTVEDSASGKLYELSEGAQSVMECPCTFSCAHGGLPCCHVLYANEVRKLPLFGAQEIPDRWRRSAPVDNVGTEVVRGSENDSNASVDYSSADEDTGICALELAPSKLLCL